MEKQTEKKSIKNRIVSAAWQLFYEKGYNGTTVDDIIELSGTSKGSFYYYFNTKDELLNTLSLILDDYYEELEAKMDPEMNSFYKLLYLNCEMHTMMEEKISIDLLASLYSTQLVAEGQSHLLDRNRNYYKLITNCGRRAEARTDTDGCSGQPDHKLLCHVRARPGFGLVPEQRGIFSGAVQQGVHADHDGAFQGIGRDKYGNTRASETDASGLSGEGCMYGIYGGL